MDSGFQYWIPSFWIPLSGVQIPDFIFGFQDSGLSTLSIPDSRYCILNFLSVELGFRNLIVSEIPFFLSWMPFRIPKPRISGFKQNFLGFWNPDNFTLNLTNGDNKETVSFVTILKFSSDRKYRVNFSNKHQLLNKRLPWLCTAFFFYCPRWVVLNETFLAQKGNFLNDSKCCPAL